MISLIQTAEGALNETHDILQRMRELATQAANDTNTETDRGEIQKEINQLTSEINRVGNTTEFNTQKLLNGGEGEGTPGVDAQAAAGTTTVDNKTVTATGGEHEAYNSITIAFETGASAGAAYSDGTITVTLEADENYNATQINTLIENISEEPPSNVTWGSIALSDEADGSTGTLWAAGADISLSGGREAQEAQEGEAGSGFSAKLQIGANQDQSFTIDINDIRAVALGVAGTSTSASETGITNAAYAPATDANDNSNALTDDSGETEYALDVSSHEAASAAIKVIDNAIETVSAERSKLGAFQNRLDHTINNLSTSAENLTAAESRIRDVDMAKELMEQTKNSILSQASQAMLAQANQLPQGVLQLLR